MPGIMDTWLKMSGYYGKNSSFKAVLPNGIFIDAAMQNAWPQAELTTRGISCGFCF